MDEAAAERLLARHAPALLGLLAADRSALTALLARPIELESDEGTIRAALAEALGPAPVDGPELYRGLRHVRHRALVRIALREILSLADIEQTSREMAWLASAVIDAALDACVRSEELRHGPAMQSDGRPARLTGLGMGKLGGLELNLGSDVDLVFFYSTDDGSAGERTIHEHYARAVQRAMKALSDVTEDGFCFRVDLRLRPEGSRGPLVNSLASAERYYQTWGRTWERAALLRARPVAGDRELGREVLDALSGFVYRRAVDPSLAEAMHEMLQRSRRELSVDPERDIKLGHGGIREVEFFVQTLQLVFGGQHPQLRVEGTLEALARLRARGLVTDREASTLERAWALLRRVEHRIHAYRGVQTHELPPEGEEREALAESLGYPDAAAFEDDLRAQRAEVSALFATLLEPSDAAAKPHLFEDVLDAVAAQAPVDELAHAIEGRLDVDDPYAAASQLARLGRRALAPLGAVSRERTPALGRALMDELREAADVDAALAFTADFFERLGGAWPYERLLLERAGLLRRLIGLFGASGTLGAALVGHPEDVDLVLSSGAPSEDEIVGSHAVLSDDATRGEPEELVRELRRRGRTFTLQIGLAHVGGEIDLDVATSLLSALAEAQIAIALEAATHWASARYGVPDAQLVVVAMGKLGGRELGFGGDLDLLFLYEHDGEVEHHGSVTTYAELFARTAQRTMRMLQQADREGRGYETDTRLRPSGSQGTLVASLASFEHYHERGAADWERQALIRARPLNGTSALKERIAACFAHLAYERGAPDRAELAHTRARLQRELAGESPDRYHPKLGYGGLVDVELLVQWLQMRHGGDEDDGSLEARAKLARDPIRSPCTLDAARALRQRGVLDADEEDRLVQSYRFLRGVEQSLRLHDAHRDPKLEPRGRTGSHVARTLGIRARDGLGSAEALDAEYRRVTTATRALFEARIGPVDAGPPWRDPAHGDDRA